MRSFTKRIDENWYRHISAHRRWQNTELTRLGRPRPNLRNPSLRNLAKTAKFAFPSQQLLPQYRKFMLFG